MAKAYLGKISALVTANTSDFNSKLNASAKEVRSFASAMESSLKSAERSAATSLRGIYTESQKVSRALQAVASQRLSFKGFDTSTFASLTQAVEQFKRIQRAASEVNQPLGSAARTIERLSASVQTAFEPAMKSAQRSAENLSAVLERGGTAGERGFERIRLKAEQAAQAANRLAEASRLATGPRGSELAFTAPRVRDALTASAAARGRAQGAAASVLDDGSVGRSVQQLARLDDLIQRVQATIESRRILNIDTAAAEQRLTRLIRRSGELSESLDAAVAAPAAAEAIRQRDAEIAAAEGQFSRRATPVGDLLRLRQEEERRRRDAEIAAAEGQFSRRATPVGDLLRLRQEEERRRRDAEIAEAQGRFSRRATPIDTAGDLERQARSRLGGDIPGGGGPLGAQLEVGRQVDNVINRVTAARQQLDTLPDPLRTALIPALQRATDQASTLARQGFGATAAQIRNAANEAERFEQRVARSQRALNFGQQFGGAGRRGLEFGLQTQSLQGYTAQLQVLQRTLSGVSTQARGPALDAFNRLRTAIATAADNGTIDLEQTRRQINGLAQDAVRAAAAAANISPGRLNRQFQRAGDIGRGAFGNIGLGVQQAVFAIEDFFSVTGGLDQRIRAAGNNISQLGFVLGGTQGLIAGVAAAITGQLIAAYIKWQNAGVGTEDRLRSLNDSLARQKSLVEDLAGAFKSIADEIGRIGFSKPGADAAQFQKQLDDIRKKQREFNQEQAAAIDPAVQRERGIIAAREAQLQRTEDPGERIRLGLDIQNARQREREALDRLGDRPGLTAAQAARAAAQSTLRARQAAIDSGFGGEAAQANPFFEQEVQRARELSSAIERRLDEVIARGGDAGEQFRTVEAGLVAERERLRAEIESGTGFFGAQSDANPARRQALTEIEDTLIQLRSGATAAANKLEIEVSKSAISAAQQIGLAQGKVADAIEAGVPGAVGLQTQLDGLTERLQEAQSELAGAQQRARESGSGGDLQAAQKAQEEVRKIQDAINARDREIKAVDVARRSVEAFSKALDAAVQEAQSNLQQSQSAADEARRQDLGFSTPATRQARAQADADLERQRALAADVDVEVAGARERFQQQVQQAQELRRRGEAAQAAVNADSALDGPMRAAGVNRAGATTYGDLAAKARELGNEKLAEQIEQTDLEVARASAALGLGRDNLWAGIREAIAEYEAVVNSAASEAERSLSRVSEIDAALGSTGVLAPGAREELTRERARLEARAIEADDAVRRARDESTREAERAGAAARGRGLSMTDGARAAEDLSRGLDDIRQFFGRQAEEGNGLVDFRAQAEAQRRLAEQSMRQTAPAIFGLADQVQNAVLQGPSRAALQATDVSTVQGASELNRLLRGDDSARNQNLVELQKQSASLSELVAIAKANGAPPGIFD
jgi:hypothetical protein